MVGLAHWWDGVELWVANLPFVPQVVLVLGVMIPLAAGAAVLLDRLVAAAMLLLSHAFVGANIDSVTEVTDRPKQELR